jgi:hypothetical protein
MLNSCETLLEDSMGESHRSTDLLDGHDDFYRVQAVQTKVLRECGSR